MAKSSSKNNRWGVLELARKRPFAAAAAATGAAAGGLFLWSKRTQISEQLNDLSERVGQWTDSMRANGDGESATDTEASGTRRPAARRKPSRAETSAVEDTSAT